jgi:hypothetical protein
MQQDWTSDQPQALQAKPAPFSTFFSVHGTVPAQVTRGA